MAKDYNSYSFRNKAVDNIQSRTNTADDPDEKLKKKQEKQKAKRVEQKKRADRVSKGLKPDEAKVTKKVAKLQSKIDRVSDKKDARQQQQKEKGFRKKTRKEKLLMKQVDAPRLKQKAKDRLGKRAKNKEGDPPNNDGGGTGSRGSKPKSRNLKEKNPVFQKMKTGESLKPIKGKRIKKY